MPEAVFLTGVTGFLGRYLLYQLAESSWIEEIIVLIRPKRGVSPEERFRRVLEDPLLVKARELGVSFDKVVVLAGDIRESKLGMSAEDIKYISERATFVVHNAAALSFATSLKEGMRNNTGPTWELYEMCCESFEKRPAFIMISTIATNSHLDLVPERVTEFSQKAENIYKYIVNAPEIEDDALNEFFKEGRLDGYGLSKGVAERMIYEHIEESGGIVPVHFVRPGGIICANKGPVPGWIHDTCFYAQLGYFIYKGQIPFFIADRKNDINMTPVDLVSGLTLACCREGLEKRENEDFSVQVVNGSKICVAGLTFDQILNTTHQRYDELRNACEDPEVINTKPPWHPWYIEHQTVFDVLFSILVWFPLWLYSLFYSGTKLCAKYYKTATLIYKYISVLKPYLVRPINIENGHWEVLHEKYPEYDMDGTVIDRDEFTFLFLSGLGQFMVGPMEARSKRFTSASVADKKKKA